MMKYQQSIQATDGLSFNLLRFFMAGGILWSLVRAYSSIQEGSPSIIAPVISVIFTVLIILIHYRRSAYQFTLYFMFFVSALGATITFITRGGINSPAPFLFFIGFAVAMILFRGKSRLILYFFLVVLIILLFYFRIFELIAFEGQLDKKNILTGTMLLLGAIVIHMKYVFAKTNEIIEKKNLELQSKQERLREQGEELKQIHDETFQINQNLEQMVLTRTEEVENRNQELSRYAFMNAHHLRAPLTRIIGLSRLIRNDYPEARKDPQLEKILDSANRTDQIIRKISDILS